MNILEIFEIIKDKEYHKDEDLIFFHNYEFEEFTQITKGYDFTESELIFSLRANTFAYIWKIYLLIHIWKMESKKYLKSK